VVQLLRDLRGLADHRCLHLHFVAKGFHLRRRCYPELLTVAAAVGLQMARTFGSASIVMDSCMNLVPVTVLYVEMRVKSSVTGVTTSTWLGTATLSRT
jgi:hypothetical protein